MADVVVGHSLVWAHMIDVLDDYPVLCDYIKRLQKRPAFQTVYGPTLPVFPDPHELRFQSWSTSQGDAPTTEEPTTAPMHRGG